MLYVRKINLHVFKYSARTAHKTHFMSVVKTDQVMLYSEIIAVCPQIHTKHINTVCGQNVECKTYRAVNTLRLGYKIQPVNAVQ